MILIAESGSTKTDWRLVDLEKTKFTTLGLNPYFVNSQQIADELTPAFNLIKDLKIKEIHFYGTGITDESKSTIIKNGIEKALGYPTIIYTYSDVIASAKALFGKKSGIACILGTGSNSCYWESEKIRFQIPPLGFWLGDEGSGGHMGKLLVLDYLHKEMPEKVRILFELKFGKMERHEILTKAYQEEKPNKYFSSFSIFLFENQKLDYCKNLIWNSFQQFIDKYLKKYPQLANSEIGFIGSIAYYYKNILTEVCKKNNIFISIIIEKPIEKLVQFHQE